jgi:hypothetical protein
VLGCEIRPFSASVMGMSCFASFPVCVYKFSSHYLDNIIFIDNSLGPVASESPCVMCDIMYMWIAQYRSVFETLYSRAQNWKFIILSWVIKWHVWDSDLLNGVFYVLPLFPVGRDTKQNVLLILFSVQLNQKII